MSKHEFALIVLTVSFALLALLFLIFYITRRVKTNSASVPLILIFLICTVISIYFGSAYYKDANLCKKCGEKAIYSTGFGKYCVDCFEEKFHRTCCRCGKEVASYVSKGEKTYCHNCATIEFGYGYRYGN